MKKSILILSVFVFYSAIFLSPKELFSQDNIFQRLDSVVYLGTNEMYKYSYDFLGNNIASIHFKWDNPQMKYLQDFKHEYIYDEFGNCISEKLSLWDTVHYQWSVRNRTEYTFDNNNQILTTKSYSNDNEEKNWELIYKSDYENKYNNNKLVSTIIYQNRNSGLYIRKYDYIYSDIGDLTEIINSRKENSDWVNAIKYEFVYDSEGVINERITYSWSYQYNGQWGQRSKQILNYDNSISYNQLMANFHYTWDTDILPFDFHVSFLVKDIQFFNYEGVEWKHTKTKKYYYSPMEITGINQKTISEISVYPNPATEYINIENRQNFSDTNISLVSLTGELISKRKMNGKLTISVSDIPAGLYLLRIESGNGKTQTEKIIIN
jgi:uncharacterized protein YkuJ